LTKKNYFYPSIKDTNKLETQSITVTEYALIIQHCRNIFLKKTRDYGTAWRILRPTSVTDQIYIKALRIRTIEQTLENKVGEGIIPEFIGIINYSIIGILQLDLVSEKNMELTEQIGSILYDQVVAETLELMQAKNHDYGEAWRDMRVSSITDLILMKLLRVKQIEDNQGQTLISEGIRANYQDILNYAVFALIKLNHAREDC